MPDLFDMLAPINPVAESMAEGAMLLRGAALSYEKDLLAALAKDGAIVVHARGVRRRGVAVVHTAVERPFDDGCGLRGPAVRPQHAFAAEREEGHGPLCRPEGSRGDGRRIS